MPDRKTSVLFAALILLYIISVLLRLGYLELEGEEPRRAVISLEMLQSGNFIRPTHLGWDYYNKPVLFNWVLCGIMYLSGSSSEFVLRLPSVFFYLLWAFCHYRVSKVFFSRGIALLSAFFMLTCADMYFYGLGNGAELDIFYSFIVYLQAISIYYFFHQKKWNWLFLSSYFFCAIGFLTKGFPSVLFQVLTFASLCFYAKSLRILVRKEHLWGLMIFFSLTGIYFFAYSFYNPPQRLLINLLNESLIKSAIGERSHKLFEKALGYPLMVLKLLAPWSLLLLFLTKKVRSGLLQNPLVQFSLLFFVFNLWVYWLTGQPKARYIYMFVPFACTILSAIYEKAAVVYKAQMTKALKYAGGVFVLAFLIIVALPFFEKVPLWVTILMAALVAAFTFIYFKTAEYRAWLFIAGIVICRLVYAGLFIPIQFEKNTNYSINIKKAAERINFGELVFWGPPNEFTISIQSKLFNYSFETIPTHAPLHSQMPYYYHKYTNRILYYDTVLSGNTNYLSFLKDINAVEIDSTFSFENKKQPGQLVIFTLKDSLQLNAKTVNASHSRGRTSF